MSNGTIVIETNSSHPTLAVAFHPDGKHLSCGNMEGVRLYRVADGLEVGDQIMMGTQVLLNVISVSTDGKWIVCGTTQGASVWDAQTQQTTVEVEGTTVDISPDSTKFATGTSSDASIWDILTGERLVGPLKHVDGVVGVMFSPNGDRFATAGRDSIHVFDSRNGDQLEAITVKPGISLQPRSTPLAWSNDGQQVFVLSTDYRIKSFKVSTGYKMAEAWSQRPRFSNTVSMALAANGKFLATTAGKSIIFWDASTLKQIGRAIEDTESVQSVALSPDCNYLATGKFGSIMIRALSGILPDSYGPFQAPTQGEPASETPQDTPQQEQEHPSTSGTHDESTTRLDSETTDDAESD